jgi:hypothetical protein
LKDPQKSLKNWSDQKWRTKSGKPSTQGPKATGERYLPESAIKSLSPSEYAATSRAKRAGKAKGKQFVAQPKENRKKDSEVPMKTIEAPKVDEKMVHDPFKKKKEKKTVIAKKGGFIQNAIKKPGALRSSLGVKEGQKIPAKKLAAAAKKPGKMGQRARLAQTLRKLGK